MAEKNTIVFAPQEEDKQPESALSKYFSPVEIFAYIIIGGSTIVTAIRSISTQFFKNLAEHNVFKDIWDKRNTSYQKLYATSLSPDELVKGKQDIEKNFHNSINVQLEKTGIPAAKGPVSYIERTYKQFNTLKRHEKTEVLSKIALVFTLASAALFYMFRNRRIEKKINTQGKKIEELKNAEGRPETQQGTDKSEMWSARYATDDKKKSSYSQTALPASMTDRVINQSNENTDRHASL